MRYMIHSTSFSQTSLELVIFFLIDFNRGWIFEKKNYITNFPVRFFVESRIPFFLFYFTERVMYFFFYKFA